MDQQLATKSHIAGTARLIFNDLSIIKPHCNPVKRRCLPAEPRRNDNLATRIVEANPNAARRRYQARNPDDQTRIAALTDVASSWPRPRPARRALSTIGTIGISAPSVFGDHIQMINADSAFGSIIIWGGVLASAAMSLANQLRVKPVAAHHQRHRQSRPLASAPHGRLACRRQHTASSRSTITASAPLAAGLWQQFRHDARAQIAARIEVLVRS